MYVRFDSFGRGNLFRWKGLIYLKANPFSSPGVAGSKSSSICIIEGIQHLNLVPPDGIVELLENGTDKLQCLFGE